MKLTSKRRGRGDKTKRRPDTSKPPAGVQTTPPTTRPTPDQDRVLRRRRVGRWLRRYDLFVPPIETSTRQAQAINPALVATHRPLAGPITGIDLETGTAVTNGPHELYAQGRITSPNVVILGDVGARKSTLGKTVYVARSVACGKQVAVFDRKKQQGRGEYHETCDLCGGTTIRFSRDGTGAINLLDPAIATSSAAGSDEEVRVGQDRLLLMAAEYAHGLLTSKEDFALRCAHRAALHRARAAERVATIHDVIEALRTPSEDAIPHEAYKAEDVVTVRHLMEWGLDVANDLSKFVDGELSGLIDGDTSTSIDWNAPLLVFDTSELDENSPALSLIMALVATFLSSVWSATPRQRIILLEEGYYTANLTGPGTTSVATILRSLVKRGRGIGLAFVTIIHHVGDLPKDSDAMSLVREAEIIHVFRQGKVDDAQTVLDVFGFPAHTAGILRRIPPGHHLLKIGAEPVRMVQHIRTPVEERITDTDGGMRGESRDHPATVPAAQGGAGR